MIARPTHKRYAHAEQYIGIRADGSETFIFCVNEKTEDGLKRELQSFKDISKSVKLFRIWTARGGPCHDEVVV